MEFKGTKGKWVFTANDPSKNRCFVNNEQIDVWHWGNIEEGKANALLISKAPEMLDFINRISGEMLRNDFVLDEKWYEQAKQLIKEATELK
jgi:hypothetical protein